MIPINDNGTYALPDWPGGPGNLQVAGTFNGATATLQFNLGPGWTSVNDEGVLDSPGGIRFDLAACKVRLVVAGGAAPELAAAIAGPLQHP